MGPKMAWVKKSYVDQTYHDMTIIADHSHDRCKRSNFHSLFNHVHTISELKSIIGCVVPPHAPHPFAPIHGGLVLVGQ